MVQILAHVYNYFKFFTLITHPSIYLIPCTRIDVDYPPAKKRK